MLKRIAIVYSIVAITVAVITTILQVQPALFFIEWLTDSSNMFSIKGAILPTCLALLLPMIPILLIARTFNKGQRDLVPTDLNGKTGILVHREKALSNALYTDDVMINGEKKSGVSNGKSTFVELLPGSYKVFVKGATTATPVISIELLSGQVIRFRTAYRADGLKMKHTLETAI